MDRRDWNMDWQMPLPGGGNVLGYSVRLSAHIEFIKESYPREEDQRCER